MKKLLFVLAIFYFFLLNFEFANAQVPSYVPTNGLVGYWPFNGNANDESGNGNNGTVNGATLTSDRNGNPNSAYHFTLANSNYINCLGNNIPIGSTSSTMSIWFNAAGFSNSGASRAMMSFGMWNGNQARYIGQRGGSSNLITYAQFGNDKNCTLNYLLNTWYHFVATYESGVVKIYINSNLLGTYTITGTATAVGNVYFGSHPRLGDYFDGNLDEAAIYNRALSQSEITQLYTGQQIPSYVPTNGLVGYWPFNGNALDESGNGNNGTVNGATLTTDRFGNAGKAYSFNGISDYIKTLSAGPTGNTSVSVSIWLKTSQTDYAQFFGYGNNYLSGNDLRLQINAHCVSVINFDTYDNVKTFSTNFTNSWDHYVFVYDRLIGSTVNSVKVYRNSIEISTSSSCFNQILSNDNFSGLIPITIGKYHSTSGSGQPAAYYSGSLDDIAIYNRVLTTTEIQNLYSSIEPNSCIANITNNDTTICKGTSVVLNSSSNNFYNSVYSLPANLQNGILGYYPFNGNANDESGNNNNGSISGATLTSNSSSQLNQAFSFDGLSNYIQLNSSIAPATQNEITYTNVVYINKPSDLSQHFIYYNGGNSEYTLSYLNANTIAFGVKLSDYNWYYASISDTTLFDKWITIVGQYKKGQYLKLYVNGQLKSTSTIPDLVFWSPNNSTRIGSYGIGGLYFKGLIDNIIIYNRILTPQEIQSLNVFTPTYLWSTGATTPSITVSPLVTTTYYCTVSDGVNTCRDSVKITVGATAVPSAPTAITGATDVCGYFSSITSATSNTVTYTAATVSTASSYTWTVPAGVTIVSGQGTNSITVTFAYSFVSGAIAVNSVNVCGASTAARSLTVYKRVAAAPAAIQKEFSPTSIVAVTNVTGLVSETYRIKKVLYATSYNWSMNQGTSATITHINPSGVNDTAVIVTFANCFVRDTLSVKSVTPCSVSAVRTSILYAYSTPAAVLGITTVGGNFATCIGVNKTFTAVRGTPTTLQAPIASFRWTRPANTSIVSATSDSASITVSFNTGYTGGSISAKGVSSCGTIGTTASTAILQFLPPGVLSIASSTGAYNACIGNSITYSALVSAPSTSQVAASVFRWTKPNFTTITSASADSSTITLQFNTGYIGGTLSVKGQTSCGTQGTAKSQALTHAGCAAGTKMSLPVTTTDASSFELSLYPNPSAGEFKLLVGVTPTMAASKAIVKVIDLQGRLIKSFECNANQVTALGNELKPGVYMVEVRMGNEVKTVRAVRF